MAREGHRPRRGKSPARPRRWCPNVAVMNIRSRLTPSMAVATTALVLAGTGTAAAGSALIDGHKIRSGSITAGKIHRGTLGSKQIRRNSLSGSQIRESGLSRVPSAAFAVHAAGADSARSATTALSAGRAGTATHATHADAATKAGTADAVGGATVHPFNLRLAKSTGATTAFDVGHLRLYATCSSAGNIQVVASTSSDHAQLFSKGNGPDTVDPDFTTAADHTLSASSELRTLVYSEIGGREVTVQYEAVSQVDQNDSTVCVLAGTATAM